MKNIFVIVGTYGLTITKIFSDEKIPVHGKGSNIRDWIHVYDHCSAVDLIIRKGTVGEIYNIGSNCEKQNIEVVKTILKEMDLSSCWNIF